MAFGTPVAAAASYSASGGASVAPSYPASIVSTDQLVLIVGQKPSTANGGTVATPTGWTLREERTGAGGYGTTLGGDTGNTNLRIYTKDTVTGSESGSLNVTVGTNNVCWAFIVQVPTNGGTIAYASTRGTDTTAGNVSVTLATDPGLTSGDIALWAMCIPTDATTPSQFSDHAISAAGATFSTPTEINEPDSSTGNDIGGFSAWTVVSSGAATEAPTITATASGTTTNVRGPLALLRMRETLPALAGSLSATESGSDAASGSGVVLLGGAFSASESGGDACISSGKVVVAGFLAASELGADSLAGSGVLFVGGLFASSEVGADTAEASGSVVVAGIKSAAETGGDLFSASGAAAVVSSGSLAASETKADTFAASGGAVLVGLMAAAESGADTLDGSGAVVVRGSASAIEQTRDAFNGTGSVRVTGGLLAAESGADSFFAEELETYSTGSLFATESGADPFAASGSVWVRGAAALIEAAGDSSTAVGRVLVGGVAAMIETGTDTMAGGIVFGFAPVGAFRGRIKKGNTRQLEVASSRRNVASAERAASYATRPEIIDVGR